MNVRWARARLLRLPNTTSCFEAMADTEKNDPLVQFAGTVAHELNNIFTAVTGNLSLLEDRVDNDSAKIVHDVIRTALRGIELSARLQAFAGRQSLRRTRFDLNSVLTGTIGGLKQSVLKDVEVEMELADQSCIVSSDEEKLRAVMTEIARNAATAMDCRGWLTVSTSIVAVREGEREGLAAGTYVRFIMRDSGRGMSPEVARRALDPGFSTKPGGSGWGLSKSAGFVRQCGGKLTLSSVLGRGTAVEIDLPRIADPATPSRPA
ncbi:MAG TPA: ATP-binding protein [Rhizomicrobium sp.]|nr:ATP-binding protein [Rhizomicrobium sp.]